MALINSNNRGLTVSSNYLKPMIQSHLNPLEKLVKARYDVNKKKEISLFEKEKIQPSECCKETIEKAT